MIIVGIDLSGPANLKDTAMAVFQESGDGLQLLEQHKNVADGLIRERVSTHCRSGEVIVGLDAPLSYAQGGGDRSGDRELRKRIVAAGMHPGSIMPPTLTRMAYLTLRGMSVSRMLHALEPQSPHIVEIHPGAVMVLGGAPVDQVRGLKKDPTVIGQLCEWLSGAGLNGLDSGTKSDHLLMAYAAALGAWRWKTGRWNWLQAASPPEHPFDYSS